MLGLFTIALLGPVGMYFLFCERNAKRIRESHFWPLGVAAWIGLSLLVIEAWVSILDHYEIHVKDEDAFPWLITFIIFLILIVGYFNVYRVHKRMMKELDED